MQTILKNYKELEVFLEDNNIKKPLVVCSHSFYKGNLYKEFENLSIIKIYFDDFKPNPEYESVVKGLKKFNDNNCDSIISVGGGSAIDVAKCIKFEINKNVCLIVSPTTAGTGSEATRFAVVYKNGEKTSVDHESLIPNAVLFDDEVLKTLPINQKKATMLDTFSHSIESLWSINSTNESKKYASNAINILIKNMNLFLENKEESFSKMFEASNNAGKAINITKTTAGHAMCYKLTTLYGIPHGHASMLINSELFPFMIENIDKCIDKRGSEYLNGIFDYIKLLINGNNDYFRELLSDLDLYNVKVNIGDLDLLVNSVNTERLSNNPIKLDKNDIKEIYIRLFNRIKENQK